MLRPVVAEKRVGDMRLQHLGKPALPLREQIPQNLMALIEAVTLQQLRRCGRRTGPCVQQGHKHLPLREAAVEHRHIADHQGDKGQSGAGLQHCKQARHVSRGRDVAHAQRKQGRPAHIKA